MGKASKKKKTLDDTRKSRVVCQTSTSGNARLFKPVVQVALIIILGVIVYSNTFTSPFVFDDISLYIVENPVIKDISYFLDPAKIVNADIDSAVKTQFRNRIFGHITFAINYKIHGLDVKGYHFVNLLIHILNALLVYLLINLTFKTPFLKNKVNYDATFNWQRRSLIAFLCALLFVAHPIQTQAVTYISQRFASLVTFFYLLSLALYIKARLSEASSRRYVYYFISLVSAVFAMKTKEISFTLPIVIALYEIMFFEGSLKKRSWYLLPFLLTMAIIPLSLLSSGSSNNIFDSIGEVSKETTPFSRADYLYTQFSVIATYLRLLFFPVNQNLDYDYPLYSSFFAPHVYLSFLMLLSILLFGGYLFYRSRGEYSFSWYFRLISFGIFYFFITLSVESSIIPIKDVIFEHRVYLPSFGFFLTVIAGVIMIQGKLKNSTFSKTIVPILFIIVIILAGSAYARNTIWKSSVSLWEDVVKKSPLKARPHYNLALYYNDYGRIHAAIDEYLTAIKLKPNYFGAHHNLGEIYDRLGRLEEAVAEHIIAIKLNPNDAKTHNNLGMSYAKIGRLEEAVAEYRRAIELKPNYAEIHMNLGVAYYKQGRLKDAYKETLYAIKLNPSSIDAHRNLAIYYNEHGDFANAIKEYSIITKLDPSDVEIYNAIGIVYNKLNRFDDAIKAYQKAITLKPGFAGAHNNLGFIYEQQGRIDDAINEYLIAVKLNPNFAEAHFSLGICYLKKKQFDDALAEFKTTLNLDPQCVEAKQYVKYLLSRSSQKSTMNSKK